MTAPPTDWRGFAPIPRLLAERLLRRATAGAAETGTAGASPDRGRPGLSVVLAVFNEEQQLSECLEHVRDLATEIVVVDGSSSDRTAEIAARLADRVIETTNKPMLEVNKNLALSAASCEWILVLDADERVSPRLRAQIEAVLAAGPSEVVGYWTPRRNYILGRWMRAMAMYPGSQLRLVRRGRGRFSERDHHLPMSVRGPVGYLTGDLIHISDRSVAEILGKRRRYAEFAAAQMHARGVRFSAAHLLFDPLRTFAVQYVLLGGWLEGIRGLLYAALSAYGAALRQLHLRALGR